jgi:ubiquinol-cytochrome c reductase iron-sulfur subunit
LDCDSNFGRADTTRFPLHRNRHGGAVGGAATLVPLIAQMNPDASTIAAGARSRSTSARSPRAGHQGVLARQADLHHPPHQERDRRGAKVNVASLPDPQPDRRASSRQGRSGSADRHLHPPRLHPARAPGHYDGCFCPCHGSHTTPPAASGRAGAGNLPLPPYEFVSDTKIRIG